MRSVVVGMAVVLASTTAHADREHDLRSGPVFLVPGLVLDVTTAGTGYGGEVSLDWFHWRPHPSGRESMPLPGYWAGYGVGGFVQLEDVRGDTDHHVRTVAGIQATWLAFGVDLGGYYDASDMTHRNDLGVRVAGFVTLGFLAVALSVSLPAVHTDAGYGTTYGLMVAFKLPLHVSGHGLFSYFVDE